MYDIGSLEQTFQEMIGYEDEETAIEKNYIKVKTIKQNAAGTLFAVVYYNDGEFFCRVFGSTERDQKEIDRTELKINEWFDIDWNTMANDEFNDPFITCTFIDESDESRLLFINLFNNYSYTHYHFLWDIVSREFIAINHESGKVEPVIH